VAYFKVICLHLPGGFESVNPSEGSLQPGGNSNSRPPPSTRYRGISGNLVATSQGTSSYSSVFLITTPIITTTAVSRNTTDRGFRVRLPGSHKISLLPQNDHTNLRHQCK